MAALPVVGWVIFFPKSALDSVHLLNEVWMVSASMWSLSLPPVSHKILHVPDKVAEPLCHESYLGMWQCLTILWRGIMHMHMESKASIWFSAGFVGKHSRAFPFPHTSHSLITVHLLYLRKSLYLFSPHAKLSGYCVLCYKPYPYLLSLSYPKEGLNTTDRKAAGLQPQFKVKLHHVGSWELKVWIWSYISFWLCNI